MDLTRRLSYEKAYDIGFNIYRDSQYRVRRRNPFKGYAAIFTYGVIGKEINS